MLFDVADTHIQSQLMIRFYLSTYGGCGAVGMLHFCFANGVWCICHYFYWLNYANFDSDVPTSSIYRWSLSATQSIIMLRIIDEWAYRFCLNCYHYHMQLGFISFHCSIHPWHLHIMMFVRIIQILTLHMFGVKLKFILKKRTFDCSRAFHWLWPN